jgi:peptide/nickel transport system substrate-binding protein
MLFLKIACCAALTVATFAIPTAALSEPEGATLRVAMAKQMLNIDTNYTIEREQIIPTQLTNGKLFAFDPEMKPVQPLVASGAEWVDATVLDVILCADVRFQDDSLFPVGDVADRINWLRSSQYHLVIADLSFSLRSNGPPRL